MAPPAFSDLGKEARDVLSKNYRKFNCCLIYINVCVYVFLSFATA